MLGKVDPVLYDLLDKRGELTVTLEAESQNTLLLIEHVEEQTGCLCEVVGFLQEYNSNNGTVTLSSIKREGPTPHPDHPSHPLIHICHIKSHRSLEKLQHGTPHSRSSRKPLQKKKIFETLSQLKKAIEKA